MDRFLWVNLHDWLLIVSTNISMNFVNWYIIRNLLNMRQWNSLMDESWSKFKILSEMEGIVNVLDEIEEDTVRMIDN